MTTTNNPDFDLKKWKEYPEIWTDSLWNIAERDKSNGHRNVYHGNFVPQIPKQFIQRYTKEGDIVADIFLGSGTTLIETKRLKRVGIGVELQPNVVQMAENIILNKEENSIFEEENNQKLEDFNQYIVTGDNASLSTNLEVKKITEKYNKKIKLLLMHPPYWDIIKYSDDKRDSSNAENLEHFKFMMGATVDNYLDLIEEGGYVVLVISDKYMNSQWVPLAFESMSEILKRPQLILKSTIIKNMAGNRAKQNQEALWRYRALAGGYYIFKHEYIFLFKKVKSK